MAKKSKRRSKKQGAAIQRQPHNELQMEILQTLMSGISLGCDCSHGLKINPRPELAIFLDYFLTDTVQHAVILQNDESLGNVKKAGIVYAGFFGFIKGSCQTGDLSLLSLRMDDIRCMMDVITSWGVFYLTKTETGKPVDGYGRVARALAMLVYTISLYLEDKGRTFQAFFSDTDSLRLFKTNDLLRLLSVDPRIAGWYFVSRGVDCKCIPKQLSCEHGFPNQPNGDSIYRFREVYDKSLDMAMEEMPFNPMRICMAISDRFEQKGQTHLWNNESKRQKIIAYLVSLRTDCVLEGEHWPAAVIAIGIKQMEETGSLHLLLRQHGSQRDDESNVRWANAQATMFRFLTDLFADLIRQTAKFYLSRSKCGCLDQKYSELRSEPKMGKCEYCLRSNDRKRLKTCSQCGSFDYCSSACQVTTICVFAFQSINMTHNFLTLNLFIYSVPIGQSTRNCAKT